MELNAKIEILNNKCDEPGNFLRSACTVCNSEHLIPQPPAVPGCSTILDITGLDITPC